METLKRAAIQQEADIFGFAGSHRSGKTTLAKMTAEDMGIPYHDASVTEIMKAAGYNGVSNMPVEKRIEAQEFLLQAYLEIIDKLPRPFITDRTPLDMLGYAMAELTMHNTSGELGLRYAEYGKACIQATCNTFDTVIITRPLSHYQEDPSKPPLNRGYQWAVQFLIEGAANIVQRYSTIVLLQTEDLADRLVNTEQVIANSIEENRKIKETVRLN